MVGFVSLHDLTLAAPHRPSPPVLKRKRSGRSDEFAPSVLGQMRQPWNAAWNRNRLHRQMDSVIKCSAQRLGPPPCNGHLQSDRPRIKIVPLSTLGADV